MPEPYSAAALTPAGARPYTDEDMTAADDAYDRAHRLGADHADALRVAIDVFTGRLAAAGRLLPADARREFGWDCGHMGEQCVHHILDESGARRMAQRRGGVAVSRVLGPWLPVPAEDAP